MSLTRRPIAEEEKRRGRQQAAEAAEDAQPDRRRIDLHGAMILQASLSFRVQGSGFPSGFRFRVRFSVQPPNPEPRILNLEL